MEMEEPWEALDLDETDISSSTSILRRCTQQPSISSQSPQPSLPPPTQSTTTVSRRRLIPGPAAAIQAAMHRIEQSNLNQNHFSQISTQRYIQRVQQDADEEFSRNPWLFALDFLRRQSVLNTTPLSAINKYANAERFDKVVAIVKSCTPNGLGDMIVTLKDPSDTIGASVHGKVFSVGDFGNFISVGTILILRKVVAFSSSCTSSYLNITRSNIEKVISVDCEVKDFPVANPDNTQVFSKTSVIPEGTSALVSRRAERVVADVHHLKGKAVMQELTLKTNYNQPKILSGSTQIDNGSHKTLKEPIQIDPVCSDPSIWKGDHSDRPENSVLPLTYLRARVIQ
ncbi:uncharacterized protein LOC130796693 isoform X2 [Amaranthus tricolor]|uniref:uncharacterized protein LOC130796693 isoform X2 n=1 Tax=Amaranthus tricolor TaxID=29722 RepID=UPI00258E5158|nr:uncharacterized protein LOC130796693 isoform X2 [Amaranthus tricolor]